MHFTRDGLKTVSKNLTIFDTQDRPKINRFQELVKVV
jgi:hypothetical protein